MAYLITQDCIGCGLCKRSCPVFAISGELKELHEINPKRCVECGVCGRVCAKEAVQTPAGERLKRVPKDKWPKPVVKPELCSACAICVDSCSPGALRIAMPAFKGDIDVAAELYEPEKCVACGLCEKRCPLKAIALALMGPPREHSEAGHVGRGGATERSGCSPSGGRSEAEFATTKEVAL